MRSSRFQKLRIVHFYVMSFSANRRAGLLFDARAGTLCLFAIINLPWRPRHFYCDESCFTPRSLSDRKKTPLSFANRACLFSQTRLCYPPRCLDVFVSKLVCSVPCEHCFSGKQNVLFRTLSSLVHIYLLISYLYYIKRPYAVHCISDITLYLCYNNVLLECTIINCISRATVAKNQLKLDLY